MNTLSIRVIDFISRKARKGAGAARSAPIRRPPGLACQWRPDPVTGRLICVWTTPSEPQEADLIGWRPDFAHRRIAA
jgi:hypothetical protein